MIVDPVLRNDWHPVARVADFAEQAILGVRLLGEDLVVWHVGEQFHAWQDLCVHRGTRLSLGKLVDDRLMCPYHGWTYNQEGRCVHMPAHPDQKPPAKARVKRFQVQQRYGLLWVCLGEPANDPPPFPEDGLPGFATAVCDPARHVKANGPRLIENFLDAAHFPFVHGGVLGDPSRPEIGDYQARIGPEGVESDAIVVYQPDPFGGTAGEVRYVYHAYRPLTAHFTKSTGASGFGLMLAITPHDEGDSTGWFIVA
ncbi:MAG TPA: aromatic ring-hydroxylating dioxygenase subunit alpha, partial [Ktedonobacterales bacterium]|nr:aromatic ring-hydroxylating dioxygenase subunit alpha [Ktedonobacterales bacterium]